MEKLTINVPNKKSALVKQILIGLGVTIQPESGTSATTYRKKLAKMSVWTDDDLKFIEDAKNAFDTLKPQQW